MKIHENLKQLNDLINSHPRGTIESIFLSAQKKIQEKHDNRIKIELDNSDVKITPATRSDGIRSASLKSLPESTIGVIAGEVLDVMRQELYHTRP